MTGYIYLVVNRISGQRYVGQTRRTIRDRWRGHIRDARRGKSYPISNAIRKHGPESFLIIELDQAASLDELNTLEPFYIGMLNTLKPNGYNLDSGGKNYVAHEETRAKISRANKGHKRCVGRILSDETKAKISKANRGRTGRLGQKNSPEHITKVSAWLRGKPSWNKGKPMSDTHRANLSAARTGRKFGPLSPEHREAISAGRIRYYRRLKEEKAATGNG